MATATRVRSAEAHDFERVTALLESLGRAKVTPETRGHCRGVFERHVFGLDADHLVAELEDGEVIGFCSLHFRDRLNYATPDAWVPDLSVAEDARRLGVGRMLLEEAERRARERGCWALTLESGYQRAEAHHLYRRAGMTDAGKSFSKLLT